MDQFLHSEAAMIFQPRRPLWRRLWIITGGQTGVDRAAFDFALEFGLPCRGWCPKDRGAEDGPIASRYPVQESPSIDPALRTELNVLDSDGTLVLSTGRPNDGTVRTIEAAQRHRRPFLCLDIAQDPDAEAVESFRSWIDQHYIRLLNVAGPRESFSPGNVYRPAYRYLEALLCR